MTRATVPGPLTRDPERTRDPGSTLGVQQVRRLRQVDTLYTCAIIEYPVSVPIMTHAKPIKITEIIMFSPT